MTSPHSKMGLETTRYDCITVTTEVWTTCLRRPPLINSWHFSHMHYWLA